MKKKQKYRINTLWAWTGIGIVCRNIGPLSAKSSITRFEFEWVWLVRFWMYRDPFQLCIELLLLLWALGPKFHSNALGRKINIVTRLENPSRFRQVVSNSILHICKTSAIASFAFHFITRFEFQWDWVLSFWMYRERFQLCIELLLLSWCQPYTCRRFAGCPNSRAAWAEVSYVHTLLKRVVTRHPPPLTSGTELWHSR